MRNSIVVLFAISLLSTVAAADGKATKTPQRKPSSSEAEVAKAGQACNDAFATLAHLKLSNCSYTFADKKHNKNEQLRLRSVAMKLTPPMKDHTDRYGRSIDVLTKKYTFTGVLVGTKETLSFADVEYFLDQDSHFLFPNDDEKLTCANETATIHIEHSQLDADSQAEYENEVMDLTDGKLNYVGKYTMYATDGKNRDQSVTTVVCNTRK